MSLAFLDPPPRGGRHARPWPVGAPPLSGRTRPPMMCRAGSKAEGSIWTARSASASGLGPLEVGRPLGQEGRHALHKAPRRGNLLLRRRLELELLVHARVDPGVELT